MATVRVRTRHAGAVTYRTSCRSRSKVQRVEHHAALPFREIGEFISRLREQSGTSPLALEFTILTAARTGEVIRATWNEFNLAEET